MQSEIKEIGPCKLSVKVEIPKEKVQGKLADKYKQFITDTIIPGFRKGHAPKDLVERKFGKYIKEDTKMDLISESYKELIKEKKLSPVMEPVIEAEKIILDENTPLAFEFIIEINPSIDLSKEKYTGVKANKIKVEVKDKEVKDALEQLRYAGRNYIPAKEGDKIGKDDLLIIDEELLIGQTSFHKRENNELIVGQEVNIFNKPHPDITSSVANMKLNETKEFSLTVPADYPKADLANKSVTLKITLKEHKKMQLPSLTDEWAKEMNLDSLEHLKKEVEQQLIKAKTNEVERKIEDEIIGHIVKSTDFNLPETLIEQGVNYTQRRLAVYLSSQGTTEETIKEELEKYQGTSRENIIKELKVHYIIEHIAKQEKIFVTEDEIAEKINEIAGKNHQWPHEVKAYYEKNNLLPELRRALREEKVRKFLREKAVLSD